jgi:ABC-type transport system involved in multi-copper enzyme maturation permease subunit
MTTEPRTAAETAPSRLRADEPTVARWVGGIGWGVIMVGLAIVGANRFSETPRMFSEGFGWLFVMIGMTMALIHSSVETDLLLRRLLGGIGAALVVVGIGWGLAMAAKERSWALGLITAVPGVFFLALYARREQDQSIRRPLLLGIGVAGLLLAAIGVFGTIIQPASMPARWSLPMVAGPILMLMYLGMAGTTDERAMYGAWGLGALALVAFAVTLFKSVVPTIIYDWHSESPMEPLAAFAVGAIVAVFGLAGIFVLGKEGTAGTTADSAKSAQKWGRIGVVVGLLLILLGALRYFAPSILASSPAEPPRPYLVPTGFVLMTAGLVYAILAIGYLSENRLVVLTRRELTAFFVSPIAYFVLAGFVFIASVSYGLFLEEILLRSERQMPMEEPIIQRYVIAFFPVVAILLSVPLLTMRLFSEERRTGTLEVLLTAPVNDWLIVMSKFLASWFFLMLLWLPWWLYLLPLRLEGGQPFDFQPMIGFTLALLVCGAAFTAMGVFFSSLTSNQIISAALTFMGMMILIGFYFAAGRISGVGALATAARSVMRALSFIDMWFEATGGKLYVRDAITQLCVAVFWLFATVKVLEFRRWS